MYNNILNDSVQPCEREKAGNSAVCCQLAKNGTSETCTTAVLPADRCHLKIPAKQITVDGESRELTPSLVALLAARQLITIQQLAATNEAKQKQKAKFLKNCKRTQELIIADIDRLCPDITPRTRSLMVMTLQDIVHEILTSPFGNYRVSTKLLTKMRCGKFRQYVKRVMNEGAAFKQCGNHSAPTDGRHMKSGKSVMSPAARSKAYTLSTEIRPINPTDNVEGNSAVFTEIKASAAQRQHIGCQSSDDPCDGPRQRRWTTGHDGLVLIDSYDWEQYQSLKRKSMRDLGWTVTQDQIAENIGRLTFCFDNDEERNTAFLAEIAAQVELKRASHVSRAERTIAEKKAMGKRAPSLKTEVKRLEKELIDGLWLSVTSLADCIDKKTEAQVYRKLGRLYGPHTSAPRWLRKYLLIEHRDGELEALVEVDLGSCYYAILASLSADSALIEAVQQGKVYELIHKTAVGKFGYSGSYSECKAACNQHCLFGHGRSGFGTHPLWKAFKSLFPFAAKKVWNIRKGHAFAPSYLYRVLTEFEAAIMVEGVIPRLIVEGVPVLNLHDGVLIPQSAQERVLKIMTLEASRRLGFRARVSIKSCVPEETQAVPTVDATAREPEVEQPELAVKTDGMLFDAEGALSGCSTYRCSILT